MEPAGIDWKNIESRFVRDELYEHINAPRWLDLSAPGSPSSADEAWFCRPDCRHPSTQEVFLLKSSPTPKPRKPMKPNSPQQMTPLGERKRSSHRRGAVLSLLLPPDSPARGPPKNKFDGKKFGDDLENEDPNLITSNLPPKRVVSQERLPPPPPLRLKSTLSARNLFSGRDILGQISEYCNEIKKLAVGKEKNSATPAAAREVAPVVASRPTPQRFPSPSGRAASSTTSPLKHVASVSDTKPVLQELDQGTRGEKKRALIAKCEEFNRVSAAVPSDDDESEWSSMNMFWFLKRCTYMGK